MTQLVRNDNYDWAILDAQGRFLGWLDHQGEPVLAARAVYDGAGNLTGLKNSDGSVAALAGTGDVTQNGSQTLTNKTLVSPILSGTVVGLTKAMVGLANVNNTADTVKPISDDTLLALNAKQATLVPGTNLKTVNGVSLLGSGDLTVAGGGGGGGALTPVAFNLAIPLDQVGGSAMPDTTVSVDRVFSIATSPAPVNEGFCVLILRGDGSHMASFPGIALWDPTYAFDNTLDRQNELLFFRKGSISYLLGHVGPIVDTTGPVWGVPHIDAGTPLVMRLPANEALAISPLPIASDFTFANLGGRTVSSITVSGSELQITFNTAFDSTSNPTVALGANKAKDLAGNFAGARATIAVTNNIPPPAGILTRVVSNATAEDLTAAGYTDWIHPQGAIYHHKNGVNLITGPVYTNANFPNWTIPQTVRLDWALGDDANNPTIADHSYGTYGVAAVSNGTVAKIAHSFPAGTVTHHATIFCAPETGDMVVRATLLDGSAGPVVDTITANGSMQKIVYTYQAAIGTSLTISAETNPAVNYFGLLGLAYKDS